MGRVSRREKFQPLIREARKIYPHVIQGAGIDEDLRRHKHGHDIERPTRNQRDDHDGALKEPLPDQGLDRMNIERVDVSRCSGLMVQSVYLAKQFSVKEEPVNPVVGEIVERENSDHVDDVPPPGQRL